jgi:hypothetical protein
MLQKISFTILLSLLLFSCRTKDVSEYGNLFESVVITDDGQLRGASIGDDLEKIKNIEQAKIVEEESDYLFYDQSLNENEYFNVAYYFDNTGLYEIMLDVTLENEKKGNDLFTSFHNFFTERHGNPKMEEGFYIWKTTSDVSEHIEIALKNNSKPNESGYVSVIVSNYDY